jgi:hypothetical protein
MSLQGWASLALCANCAWMDSLAALLVKDSKSAGETLYGTVALAV